MANRRTVGYLRAKSPFLYPGERHSIRLLDNLGIHFHAAYWDSDGKRILLFSIPSRLDGDDTVTVEANSVEDFYAQEFDRVAQSYMDLY